MDSQGVDWSEMAASFHININTHFDSLEAEISRPAQQILPISALLCQAISCGTASFL
jgi:hypothetical protein